MTGHKSALAIVAGALAAVLAPPATMMPSAWAAEHLIVPDGPRSGSKWDRSLTPYVPEIIDAFGPDSETTFGVVRKSQQTGVSVAGIGLLGYYIDAAPARLSYAAPTIDQLQEFNREKLSPVLEQTDVLRAKVKGQTSRSATGSTTTSKRFPGGSLVLINANSTKDLRSKTLKVGVADEIDEWADDLDKQGDPLDLYLGRFTAFHATGDWRLLALSTPTLTGSSRVDRLYLAGDQRLWKVRCPHCGEEFHFEFKGLKFNRKAPYEAHYVAPCCGTIIEHHEKATLVRAGRFVPTNSDGLYPSWHIDALISQLTTWDHIAEAWWNAQGNDTNLKAFYNLWLGLSFEMRGDAPDHEKLYARRDQDLEENRIPPRGLLLTAGADVQHSGIWVEVVAWAPDRQSWTVSARWLDGDTDVPNAGAWLKLASVYDERFPDAFGRMREIDAMAVDAGDGGRSNQVYTFARGRARAFAIYGIDGWTRPAIGTPTRVDITLAGKRIRRGATLWPVGTWPLKGDFYSYLRKPGRADGADADPPGYCHFGGFLDLNYFKQITAEYLGEEKFKGRTRRRWMPSRDDNHFLDCRVYATAMAEYLGLSRMTAEQWARVASTRGVPAELADPDLLAPEPVKIAAAAADAPPKPAPPTPKPALKRKPGDGGGYFDERVEDFW